MFYQKLNEVAAAACVVLCACGTSVMEKQT